MRKLAAAALAATLAATFWAQMAGANDGVGGITNTGLVFGSTDAVAMEKEDLFLSLDEIRVDYAFRNITDEDVTLLIAFPIPPVSLILPEYGDFAIAYDAMKDPNFMGFTVTVDGKPVAFETEVKAYMVPAWESSEGEPPARQFDEPGEDITAVLASYNIPVTYDPAGVMAALNALPKAKRDALAARGIIALADDGSVQPPSWSIGWRHYWTQEFPAGRVVRISHRYAPVNPASIYSWTDEEETEYDISGRMEYCIDAGTGRAIKRLLEYKQEDGTISHYGTAFYLHYILRTASTWAGPIGEFTLTIDKGGTNRIISLCLDGIRKTGPTTFEWKARNFTPNQDLKVLFVQSINYE